MGFASRNFYVSFLAVVEVMQNADQHYADHAPRDSWAFDTIVPTSFVDAKVLAGHFGCDVDLLAELNPAFTRRVWAGERFIPPGMTVRVPRSETSASLAASLPEEAQHAKQRATKGTTRYHTVRRGETLAEIAARYRTSVAKLKELNRIRNANEILVGQRIRVPGRRS
jgi:membrane-bound lytic murein transglycosylase D